MNPQVPQRVQEINAQLAASPLGVQGIVQAPSAITSADLISTAPLKVTNPVPSTGYNALGGFIETQTQNFQQQQQADAAVQAENMRIQNELKLKEASQKSFKERLFGAPTQSGLEASALEASGANVARQELNDINNQILSEQNAARRQIEALDKTFTGTLAGKQAEINRINKESMSRQADLSIIQMAKSNNYALAKEIADRKVDAELEQFRNETAALKFDYEENKEQYTKDEQRQFDAMIKKRDQEEKKKEADTKSIQAIGLEYLQNGGNPIVAKQILASSSVDTAASLAGNVLGSVDRAYKLAQTAKLNVEAKAAGLPQIVNSNATNASKALSVILGSQNFTKEQKISLINSINSGNDPFTVIKNQAKNIMGQTEATTITKYETAKSALQDLQATLATYYANGGKTNILTGNYEKAINKLGEVKDPKLVDLATQIQTQLQVYRNAVSGTAYSEQEGKDIASIFPGINKTEGLNMAILGARLKAFDSTIDGAYKATLGNVYNDLKAEEVVAKNQGQKIIAPDGTEVILID